MTSSWLTLIYHPTCRSHEISYTHMCIYVKMTRLSLMLLFRNNMLYCRSNGSVWNTNHHCYQTISANIVNIIYTEIAIREWISSYIYVKQWVWLRIHVIFVKGILLFVSNCICMTNWGVIETLVNILRPSKNGRHVADDIFKCIFLNENIWIPTKISLNYVPYGLIDNMAALVQIIALRRPGDKPLSETMMGKFGDAYLRLSASMS